MLGYSVKFAQKLMTSISCRHMQATFYEKSTNIFCDDTEIIRLENQRDLNRGKRNLSYILIRRIHDVLLKSLVFPSLYIGSACGISISDRLVRKL